MSRNPPRRAGDAEPAPLTTDRLLDLTEIVARADCTIGPLDQEDLQKALDELVYRRSCAPDVVAVSTPESPTPLINRLPHGSSL